MKIAGVALMLLMLCAPTAGAQQADCTDPQDQLSLTLCARQAFDVADGTLNEVYTSLAATLGPQGRDRLRRAQRAWIAYRDAQCVFEVAGVAGGSIQPMMTADCLRSVTEAQTARLADQLNCVEGDLSCGVR